MPRLRTLCVAAGAAALAALSASLALGRVTERHNPLVSAALPTVNGIGLAENAELILAAHMSEGPVPTLKLPGADRERALALSRRAYHAEPLSVTAVRNIGLILDAEGRTAEARKLMRDAERLTRRDLSTNGWLVRDYGQRNEIEPALAAFDHALRTSSAGQQMLLPVMLENLAQPALIEPLVHLLRQNPPWAEPFWREAPKHRTAIANVASIRVALVKEGIRGDFDRNLSLLRALTSAQEFRAAESLFDAVAPTPLAPGRLLRNEDFDQVSLYEPFDWRVLFDSQISADISPADGSMRIQTFADGSGTVALQLVVLQPGTYNLSVRATEWDALDRNALQLRVRCADPDDGERQAFSIDSPDFSTRFALRSNCRYYWLELRARAQPQRQDNTILLDSIRLRRVGTGAGQ